MTMPDLNGRVALITGAAGNLGRATARAFQRAAASTALVDRSVDRLAKLYPELVDAPDHLLAGDIDLTDADSVERLIKSVKERWGRVDALVNTVGTFRGGKPVHEEALETWDLLFTVNVRTTLLASRAVVPLMLEQGAGRIVNVASRNALEGGARVAAYSATKSAVVRLTESMAAELKASNIKVNAVLPGTIDTPENRAAMPDADFDSWVSPEAIADVIVFLASDASRGMTGAALPVYGRG